MTDGYFLPEKKARTCRRAGILFLVAAVYGAIGVTLGATMPGLQVSCELPKPCVAKIDPVAMLTEDERTFVAQHPAARSGVNAWAAKPVVRVGLGMINVLDSGPVVFLLLAVGMALRRLGTRGNHVLAQAIPWLKHASRAGLVWAVLGFFTQGTRSMLLAPGTGNLQFPIDLSHVLLALLLAVAAYVTAWALEAGIRAERDLADFV